MTTTHQRYLAWNDIEIPIPPEFQVIVKGPCHLLIERDFTPLLEIRWQKFGRSTNLPALPADFTNVIFAPTSNSTPREELAWQKLVRGKQAQVFRRGASPLPFGSLWHETEHGQVVLVELQAETEESRLQCLELLTTLKWQEQITRRWAIQDFQVELPSATSLLHYSFKPGLTRLSFSWDKATLHLCRLAPASLRLAQQDLASILGDLAAEPDLKTTEEKQVTKEIRAFRTASGWLRFRQKLRRRPAHLAAYLRHLEREDRLLALVCSGNQALDQQGLEIIWQSYGLI